MSTPGKHLDKEPSPHARQMLVALYAAGKYTEAEAMAQILTKQFPKHGFGWKVWGAVLKKMGRVAEALAPMQKAVVLMPKDHEAQNNLGVTLKDLGRIAQAESCYRNALSLKPDYADAFGNLGDVLREQGKLEQALSAYRRKLQYAPDDGETQHHIAALAGEHTDKAPQQYVQGVFNAYADKFDSHLQQVLHYNVPEQLAGLIERHPPASPQAWRVLDLGCGTGLVGQALAARTPQLVGVDLSSKMLEKAQARQIYQRLVCADVQSMMEAEPEASYDLITSADVFIYIGAMDGIAQQAKRLLTPGGVFAFSIETLNDDSLPYKLRPSGRYAQSLHYLAQLATACAFEQMVCEATQIRMDQRQPIEGHLVIWRALPII